jgi:hypothetical protein
MRSGSFRRKRFEWDAKTGDKMRIAFHFPPLYSRNPAASASTLH